MKVLVEMAANNFSSTSKVYSVMVPKGITNDYLRLNLSAKNRKLIAESKLSKSCYLWKQNLTVHGTGRFSKKHFAQGLSEKFVTLILDSRKKDAISHYESIVILLLQSEQSFKTFNLLVPQRPRVQLFVTTGLQFLDTMNLLVLFQSVNIHVKMTKWLGSLIIEAQILALLIIVCWNRVINFLESLNSERFIALKLTAVLALTGSSWAHQNCY